MLNKKEILSISVITLILGFTISLLKTWENFAYTLLIVFLVLMINIASKKAIAFYFESDIDIKIWEIKKYGFKANQNFKKPFPAGAFFPVISKILLFSLNGFVWMASLVFDIKPKTYSAAKRHGFYSFSEISEFHLGLIAAAGIAANIIFAIIGYFLGFSEFSRISIYYVFFNMIPISDLDGNKIFFGNLVLWSFLASIALIGLFCAIFII